MLKISYAGYLGLSPTISSQFTVEIRDVHETFWAETETRRCSFRDAGRDLEAPETLESLESPGSFNVSLRRFPWRMVKRIDNDKKLYRLINSHRGKRFPFRCAVARGRQRQKYLDSSCASW